MTTHGLTKGRVVPPELYVWNTMIQRCHNPKSQSYAKYGGRGIQVCQRWRDSFLAFWEDMGPRPEGLTLDRFPNNNGNYEPGNVRWATRTEQAVNRRSTKFIEHDGRTLCLQDWAKELGLSNSTTVSRWLDDGYTIAELFTLKSKGRFPLKIGSNRSRKNTLT